MKNLYDLEKLKSRKDEVMEFKEKKRIRDVSIMESMDKEAVAIRHIADVCLATVLRDLAHDFRLPYLLEQQIKERAFADSPTIKSVGSEICLLIARDRFEALMLALTSGEIARRKWKYEKKK